jgi:hypothetical protein
LVVIGGDEMILNIYMNFVYLEININGDVYSLQIRLFPIFVHSVNECLPTDWQKPGAFPSG